MELELMIELIDEDVFHIELENDIQEVVTTDYEKLQNLPSINSVKLIGNKQFEELGVSRLTNSELEQLLGGD